MRWRDLKRGQGGDVKVQDRRGQGGGMPAGLKIGGGGGLLLVLALLIIPQLLGGGGGGLGGGIGDILEQMKKGAQPQAPGGAPAPTRDPSQPDPQSELVDFTSAVMNDVSQMWEEIFVASNKAYQHPTYQIFTQGTQGACGYAPSQVGPHYCPLDQTVYVDLDFLLALQDKLGAQGDFAQAYVLAHEVGHHIQQQLGISDQVRAEQQENPSKAKESSIKIELQADCFAGVWGQRVYQEGILEAGDVEEGINAALAVGDDRIQEQTTGQIRPEEWTHGSAAERSKWFQIGFNSGDPNKCNTFA